MFCDFPQLFKYASEMWHLLKHSVHFHQIKTGYVVKQLVKKGVFPFFMLKDTQEATVRVCKGGRQPQQALCSVLRRPEAKQVGDTMGIWF